MTSPRTRAGPLLVWGAGAMGGTIGAVLARAGHPVRFVDRARDHVEAMNATGLRVQGPFADFLVPAEGVTPDDLTARYDRILLCVKAHHTREAAVQLKPHLAENGYVVSIQNGLNEPVIADVVGPGRTLGAFVNFGADYLGPGVIHWGGRGAVVLGELDGRSTERLEALVTALRDFEPGALTTDNIFGYLWSKLAYAALLFATALTDDGIADCLADTRARPLFLGLAREVCRVATASGVRLEPFDGFDPRAFLPGAGAGAGEASLDDLVTFNRRSAKTHSGIWRDLAVRKRRTEVDAQLVPVVEAGRAAGVPTPLVEAVVSRIHEIEGGTRGRGRANLDELTHRAEQEAGRGG